MSRRRRRSSLLSGSPWSTVAVVVVVALAIAGAVAALTRSPSPPDHYTSTYTPSVAPIGATPPLRTPLSAVVDRLRKPNKPVTVLIIGDSTASYSETNWVTLTTRWLGRRYDRPVTLHPWSEGFTPPGYGNPVAIQGDGTGAPITVWDGSAAGMDAGYALSKLDQMAPVPASTIDWVIVDEGHNSAPGQLGTQGEALLDEVQNRWPQASVTVVAQNPETLPDRIDKHAQNVADLVAYATSEHYAVMDVFSAFTQAGVAGLVDETGIHPTPAGYQLWARTAEEMVKAADQK